MRLLSVKALASAAAIAVCLAEVASAETVLKVQTSFNAGDLSYRVLNDEWAPKLEEMSGGELSIELLPIGSVVPHRETMNAVGNGLLQGDLTSTSYFAGYDKVFALLGDLTAGYDTPAQLTMFCNQGGGREILQEAIDQYSGGKVHVVGCAAVGREALVSAAAINGIDKLKGLKIRAPEGLASEVFKRAGATPVAIPASEIFTAIEKGVVDAADGSNYATDKARGMHDVAKYPLYPGIHSMPIQQFTINKAIWEEIGPKNQILLGIWYQRAFLDLREKALMEDLEAVANDQAGSDLTVINWLQEDRDAFRAIAQGAWEDFATDSELARKAYDANIAFMQQLGLLEK